MHKFSLLLLSFFVVSCQSPHIKVKSDMNDQYLWLEEVEGQKALEFARKHNEETLGHFKKNPMFARVEKEVRKISLADDRMPSVYFIGSELYNFWQDKKHVQGIWRKTTLQSYKTQNPQWETILDLDALSKKEKETWVWHGTELLEPERDRALVYLSRGGKDAHIIREFDMKAKKFITSGFTVPEAKSSAAWMNKDQVIITTDFGPNSMTNSGYPRIVKLWQRGTPLSSAKEIFQAQTTDMSAFSFLQKNPEGKYLFHSRRISFYESENTYEDGQGKRTLLPFPRTAEFEGVFKEYLLVSLKEDWGPYKKGTLLSLPLSQVGLSRDEALKRAQVVFAPTEKVFFQNVGITKNYLLLNTLNDILPQIARVELTADKTWKSTPVALGPSGSTTAYSTDSLEENYLIQYSDALTPPSIFLGKATSENPKPLLLKSAPARFNSKDMIVQRFSAKSKDGTEIPYFVISKKKLAPNAENPTLLYGYGGFQIPMIPGYMTIAGKVWIEQGGVYVIANLRGGSEFGPAWHQSVLKLNRPKVYQDFAAVAEDLIQRNITKPEHLGISGRSNGGLLTGATFIQRPELFGAVISGVPLLDMMRYHKLLAGASWMDEYGNPDDPQEGAVLQSYSPYHNIRRDVTYPEVLFMTSTKDDRVHPGHARKMVARMEELGHKVYYYENTEGGHGGSANIEQKILWDTLEFTYLWEKLGAQP